MLTVADITRILKDHRALPSDHDLTAERIIETLSEVLERPASETEAELIRLERTFE